jgi:hypothetical protein
MNGQETSSWPRLVVNGSQVGERVLRTEEWYSSTNRRLVEGPRLAYPLYRNMHHDRHRGHRSIPFFCPAWEHPSCPARTSSPAAHQPIRQS